MTLPSSDLFQAALAQVWQIAALTLIVAVIVWRFCRSRPHLAYALWFLVIIKCLTPPIWSSPFGLFSWAQLNVQSGDDISGTFSDDAAQVVDPDGEPPARLTAHLRDHSEAAEAAKAVIVNDGGMPSATTLAGWTWLAGMLFVMGVIALGWVRCRRMIARCPGGPDAQLGRQIAALARHLAIHRPIDVILSDEPIGPAVFGTLRPKLILPRTLVASRRFDQIEPVIAHELIHVRRWDATMMLIELVAKIVWWFHPLVWWAGCQANRERERCCDADTVVAGRYRPARYARCLLDVLEHKQELRTAFLLPGVRPVEVTSKRLEEIMRRASTRRNRTPRYCWVIAAIAALVVLPGSPLVIETAAEPNDQITAAELQDKLARLEDAAWQAGLTTDETKALLKLAERVKCDQKTLMSLKAKDKLSEVEAKAVQKLIGHFGNPLDEDLAELRAAGAQAGLSDAEVAAAEKLAVREGFDEKAIAAAYEVGKLSDVERKAVKKLFAHFGHPYADELEGLAKLASQAGLTDAETAALKRGFVRVGCDAQAVVELKKSGGLTQEEAAALKKLEADFGKLEYHIDNPRKEDVQVFVKLARLAEMTATETDAMMALLKRADWDEQAVLEWKRSGKLSDQEAAAIAKLEGIIGKLEDFVEDRNKKKVGELIEAALKVQLSLEETKALMKLAVLVDFDHNVVQRLKDAGRLTDLEIKALDKVESQLGR